MIDMAERIRDRNRAWRRAQPASQSRIAALNTFGLRYETVDDFNVIVEGRYHLNLAMSYWRADDSSSHGYLISALAAEIAREGALTADIASFVNDIFNSEKPVAGRDSGADQGRTASTTTEKPEPALAESAAGPPSPPIVPAVPAVPTAATPSVGSASLLPKVEP